MSWGIPNAGQWTAPMGMAPEMSIGSFTPEQWAALQQQNWHQWAQWHQQYAQWQSQYGEKYAQQMQAIQSVGKLPPLPPVNTAPPPAPPAPPPPPDQPPPPPHENNQPLFGQGGGKASSLAQPAPVPAPNQNVHKNTDSYNNTSTPTVNQNRPYQSEPNKGLKNEADPLKKLAEEERLFEVQFEKWEQEIEKWRKDNVNHPDKQAYLEYEKKFETCRAQLLERRRQMKLKKAKLLDLGTPQPPPQPPNTTTTSMSIQNNLNKNNYDNNTAPQNYPNQYQQSQKYLQQNTSSHQSHQQGAQSSYNSNTNKKFDSQDRYESYSHRKEPTGDYGFQGNPSPVHSGNSDFLPKNSFVKGIPGLDLVPEVEKSSQSAPKDVVIISEEIEHAGPQSDVFKPPDYSTISKGINNILGDEKIMNILSMVQGNNRPPQTPANQNTQQQNYPYSNNNFIQNQQQDRYQDNFKQQVRYQDNFNQQDRHQGNFNQQDRHQENFNQQDRHQENFNEQDRHQENFNQQDRHQENFNQQDRHQENFNQQDRHQENFNQQDRYSDNFKQQDRYQDNFKQQDRYQDNFKQQDRYQDNFKQQDKYQGNFKQQDRYQDNFKQQDRYQDNFKQQDRYQDNCNNEQQNNRQLAYDRQNVNCPTPQNQDNYTNQQQNYRQNLPYNKQDQNYTGLQNLDFNPKYPPPKRILDERLPDNIKPDQYLNRNFRPNAPNLPTPAFDGPIARPRPSLLMPPDTQAKIIPALLDLPGPCKNNYFPRGSPETNIESQLSPQSNRLTPVDQPSTVTKWVEEPLFTPSIIVEYEHKPLRLKARDFIEPVHIFEYNHKSKNEELRQKDLEKEAQELFVRKPRRDLDDEYEISQKYRADFYNRDFERRIPKDDLRNEIRSNSRLPPREDYERRRMDDRYDDRRREDRYMRRDDFRDARDVRDDKDRERDRDRYRDMRREKNRSRSRERDMRKRGHSRDSSSSCYSAIKKSRESVESPTPRVDEVTHVVMIDDLLEEPGRAIRPEKIVIILRGPPGSGKSYLAKLIRDKEAEHGGTARIMSIDDYFMQEGEIEEKDPITGRIVKKTTLKYEYDKNSEEIYFNSLKRAFKRSFTDGYFSFLIFDAVNDQLKHYADVWNNARQCGFQVYICTMELDPHICFKRNIHNRSLEEVEEISSKFFPTPSHHIQLDATTLLQNAAIPDVTMEDVVEEVDMEDAEEPEVETIFTSKWETMDDATQLARLDGISKPLRPSQLSMEDYLQLDDWMPNTAKPGKKTVRWADIEESRQQEKMRAIGFVVGQTDWNRMTDPTMGSSALTQTKYIERVRRN